MKVLCNVLVLTTSETSDSDLVVSSKLRSMSPLRNAENISGELMYKMTLMLQNCHSRLNSCIIRCPNTQSETIM